MKSKQKLGIIKSLKKDNIMKPRQRAFIKAFQKMLENRPEDALDLLVLTVYSV